MNRRGQGGTPGRGPLLALCAAALVLFNFPMLTIFDRGVTVCGLPLLPVALFAIWAGLILLLALIGERPGRGGGHAVGRGCAAGGGGG